MKTSSPATELDSFFPTTALVFSSVLRCFFSKNSLIKSVSRPPKCVISTETVMSLLPLVVSFVCYANGLKGDFVHDDIPAVLRNSDVNGESSCVLSILRNDFWGTPLKSQRSHKSYRPLTTLLFR